MTTQYNEERVQRGIDFLNSHPKTKDNWLKNIDPDKIKMESSTQCVLSMALGIRFSAAFGVVGLTDDMSRRCGFTGEDYEYRELTKTWKRAIRKLQRKIAKPNLHKGFTTRKVTRIQGCFNMADVKDLLGLPGDARVTYNENTDDFSFKYTVKETR